MIIHLWVIVFDEIQLSMMASLEALVIYYNSGTNKIKALQNIKMPKLSRLFFYQMQQLHYITESKAKMHFKVFYNIKRIENCILNKRLPNWRECKILLYCI